MSVNLPNSFRQHYSILILHRRRFILEFLRKYAVKLCAYRIILKTKNSVALQTIKYNAPQCPVY